LFDEETGHPRLAWGQDQIRRTASYSSAASLFDTLCGRSRPLTPKKEKEKKEKHTKV
jgi:hypothetical protein